MKRIILTCGDHDGVGAEVIGKATTILQDQLKPHKLLIYASAETNLQHLEYANEIQNVEQVCDDRPGIFLLKRSDNPTNWVSEAVSLCEQNDFDALVTGPLSKTTSKESEHNVLGHTDLFRNRFPNANILMCFMGSEFNVALITDHIPLKNVTDTVNIKKYKSCLQDLLKLKNEKQLSGPIGVVGINPHAGEDGLLGEEDEVLKEIIQAFPNSEVVGPLVPDAAFQKPNWSKYSFFVCLYHDQGLIPFKLVHGQDSGIQLSLGLPFLRTSVDHGTAKDIYDLNQANPNSMVEAIKFCL